MKKKTFLFLFVFTLSFSQLFAQGTDRKEWKTKNVSKKNVKEAELYVRTGDIDNLGFEFPEGYDPFSGNSTDSHGFPFSPESDDPAGTDRIMVVTGFTGNEAPPTDGYTGYTLENYDNKPAGIKLNYDLTGINVNSMLLQIFIDDFQAPQLGTVFQVTINNVRIPYLENMINSIDQTGPVGKLISYEIPPEYYDLVKNGIEIKFDDPLNNVGEGFAVDFVQLLVNPKINSRTGTITGVVTDETGSPIQGALVSTGTLTGATTDASGKYTLTGIPAGYIVVKGSKTGYSNDSKTTDLIMGKTQTVNLMLRKADENVSSINESINKTGNAVIYGIYFDSGKWDLKPESDAALRSVLEFIKGRPGTKIIISGHTDSNGGDAFNMDLSQKRAEAVIAWLVQNGADGSNLIPKGYGKTKPIASNSTDEGRSLNRRVEIDLSK